MTGDTQCEKRRGENPLLLVVDDDEDTRLNLRDILELQHYEVATAGSVAELFDFRRLPEVSLVLLDRRLPDGSPKEVVPRLRASAPQAEVIIVTGYGDIEGAIAALQIGAADYILKPVNPDALLASVRRVLHAQADAREISRLNAYLQTSEEQYRSLFENALDGLIILNDAQQVIAANPAASAILGIPANELAGQSFDSLAKIGNGQPQPLAWRELFTPGRLAGEITLIRKDGQTVELEYRTVISFIPDRHLVSLRDITARKRAEERARQAGRLAAIGETMTALVHESRNALQRSKASLEMLALEIEDRPEAMKLASRVERAQEDLHRLFEEVRQWAAPLNLRKETCNLRDVWLEAWGYLVQTPAGKGFRLIEDIDCEPICEVDRFAMAQVFRNIFENAVEASPPGHPIEVSCRERTSGPKSELAIAIRDRGPGLTPVQQQRIFDAFYTTKAKGTGLGMSIASRIVQSHGGSIRASTNGGAQIEITLAKGAP